MRSLLITHIEHNGGISEQPVIKVTKVVTSHKIQKINRPTTIQYHDKCYEQSYQTILQNTACDTRTKLFAQALPTT